MNKYLQTLLVAVFTLSTHYAADAAEFYIAPGGSDSNNGSLGSPFATFSKAIGLATAGDTIYARGGTYNLSSTISIGSSKSGTAGNPISLLAYPGETPILDFRGQPYNASNGGLKGISLSGSYWHFKGLTIQYAADNGIIVSGSHNIIEQVVARQNQDAGFQINGGSAFPSDNLFLNCDSYGNFDYGLGGENADGFAIKQRGLGPGNIISGARAWNNSDDGIDFWEGESGVTVVNSWVFNNGLASVFNNPAGFTGDGNGIKLGHDSGTHVLENMLIWGNPAMGVDINGNATELENPDPEDFIPHGVQVYNVTAALNGTRNFNFDENPTTASPPTQHILRNNISYSGSTRIDAGNTADHNTFNGPSGSPAGLGVTAADFVSVVNPVTANGNYHPAGTGGDRSGVTTPVHATGPAVGPRLADGSLPLIDFLRLAPGSHLIDAGVNVGLPFNGSAPDLGAFEYSAPVVYDPADFNLDFSVDEADLSFWQLGYGTQSGAQKNDGDADDDGDVDARDFLIWQRNYAPGALSASTAVPEPASGMLCILAVAGVGGCRLHREREM
jgi:hypothetical protein